MSWSCAKFCQKIFGRHFVHGVDLFPPAQTNSSQPCQLQQVFAGAGYDDKHSGTSLPRCKIPHVLEETGADKEAPPGYDKVMLAEGPSLSPCTPTYLLETPPTRQPADCQVTQGWAPAQSGKQRSSCLQQQDGDAASIHYRLSTSGDAVQNYSIVRSDTTCAMQSGVGEMRQSNKCNKFALRPPLGRAPRTKETISSLQLSKDCTAVLHKAGLRATGEAFALHAWCASVGAASSAPADRHAITDVYASRKRILRTTIMQLAAETHDVPYNSRKRRKLA